MKFSAIEQLVRWSESVCARAICRAPAVLLSMTLLLLAATGCSRSKTKSAQVDNLAQAVATIEALRASARNEPAGTMERLALPLAQEQFKKLSSDLWVNVVPQAGWSNFFASAGYSMAFSPDACLVPFYDAWADVVLVTLWEKQKSKRWQISDMEILLGDFVRREGKPPYDPTPAWTLEKKLPAIAIADTTQATFDAFTKTLTSNASRMAGMKEWRSAFSGAQDERVLGANHQGAGEALERNIHGLLEFLGDKAISGEIDGVFAKLLQGKLDEVLASATATPKETAELLRRHMPEHWEELHLASYAGAENSRYVLFETNPPDTFVSFTVSAKKNAAPSVVRLDLINHRVYRDFLRGEK